MRWRGLWSQLLVQLQLQQCWLRAGWERAQSVASGMDTDASAEAPCESSCVTAACYAQDTQPVFRAVRNFTHIRKGDGTRQEQ